MLNLLMMVLEEDVDDGMEINSKPAENSREALAMLYKLQIFFKENDAENKILQSVVSLTKKSRENKNQIKKNKKLSAIFFSNVLMEDNINHID